MNKLKDVAGLLKAKITKDQLQQALINATSQQNWQTSTHILHQIANAAYNYQKCQQITQFIWDKLKKGKSWRKILKALNLVQFLLKNGPPSIINTYKYQIYQFRSFDSFSHYDQGIDRGQSIRQKSKIVVDLLSNQQLLEQQRVKAKTIRQKMSGIVGGSGYGASNSNFSSNAKYGSIDNKSYSSNGYSAGNSLIANQGYNGGLGTYGDYTYTKSTLDKYKDNKDKLIQNKNTSSKNINVQSNKQEKNQIVIDNKKPFEKIAPKLVKPGSKPAPIKQQSTNQQQKGNNKQSGGDLMDDIFDVSQPVQHVQSPVQPKFQPQVQPVPQLQVQPQTSNPTQNNSFPLQQFSFQPQPQTPITQQSLINQSLPINQPYQSTQLPQTNLYSQPQVNLYGMNVQQQNYPNNNLGYNNQQSMMGGYNYNNPNNNSLNMSGNYANLGYPQQQPINYGLNMQTNQQSYGQIQQIQQPISLNPQPLLTNFTPPQSVNTKLLTGISLSTTTTSNNKKQQDEFGNFLSGQNNNVKWLSNQQKGLIDFSDFGEELKKQTKNNNNKQNDTQIDTTWTW